MRKFSVLCCAVAITSLSIGCMNVKYNFAYEFDDLQNNQRQDRA